MFGDELILGVKELTIDNKGRIFLPKKSGCETGDKIVFASSDEGLITLYNYTAIENKIKYYNRRINASENIKFIEAMQNEMKKVYASCLGTGNVDKQGRVTIPAHIIEEYGLSETVIAQGCGKGLTLFKSKEEREQYIRSLK